MVLRPETAGLLLGLVAYVGSNLGMGLQKQGVNGLVPVLRHGLPPPGPQRTQLATWLAGTTLTVGGSVLLFVALGLGRASVVASLEGVGLIALAGFARWRLGERLGGGSVLGIGAIIVGTAMVSGADGPVGPRATGATLAGAVVAAPVLLGMATLLARAVGRGRGVAHGALAGSTIGAAMVVQKLIGEHALQQSGRASELALLGAAWLGLAGVGFVLTQWAWLNGRALTVAPAFAAFSVTVPVVAGWSVLGEPAPAQSVAGVLLLLGGIVPVAAESAVGRLLQPPDRPAAPTPQGPQPPAGSQIPAGHRDTTPPASDP